MFGLYLDLMTRPDAQYEPTIGEIIYRGRRHGYGWRSADKDTGYAGTEFDSFGGQGASSKDRKLVSAVALSHPCRLITKFLCHFHAFDYILR